MRLQKIIHSSLDFFDIVDSEYTEKNSIVIHGVNEISLGGEFTICGRAIPDASIVIEGWERVGEEFTGSISKCECKDCLKIIRYYKSLK